MAVDINGTTGLTFNNGSAQDVGGIGTGSQAWTNVTASRAFSTTYTNTTGKPIMVSDFSGHKDFLPDDMIYYIPGQMTNVHPSAANDWLMKESQWFTVDYGYAMGLFKDIEKNYKKSLEKSRKTYHYIKTNFSFDKMKEKLESILTDRVPEFPKQHELKLPKMKKIELPKMKKI